MDFAFPADPTVKLKIGKKRDKYLDLAREFFKTMEQEGDDDNKFYLVSLVQSSRDCYRDWRRWK